MDPKLFFTQNLFIMFINIIFLDPKLFEPNIIFGPNTFLAPKFFWAQTLFEPKIISVPKIFIWTNFFSEQKIFQTQFFFFDPKRSSLVFWYKPTKPKSFEPKTFQAEHFRPKSCLNLFFSYFIKVLELESS